MDLRGKLTNKSLELIHPLGSASFDIPVNFFERDLSTGLPGMFKDRIIEAQVSAYLNRLLDQKVYLYRLVYRFRCNRLHLFLSSEVLPLVSGFEIQCYAEIVINVRWIQIGLLRDNEEGVINRGKPCTVLNWPNKEEYRKPISSSRYTKVVCQ